MAYQLADSKSHEPAKTIQPQTETQSNSTPDFSQYRLPSDTLFKPIPGFKLPERLLGPSPISDTNRFEQPSHLLRKPGTSRDTVVSPTTPQVPADYIPNATDMEEFDFCAPLFVRSFSKDDLAKMAANNQLKDGAQRTANFLLNNFDTVKSLTAAGGEDYVHMHDIELLVDLAQAKTAINTVATAKEHLSKEFGDIDIDDNQILSESELHKVKESASNESDVRAFSALIDVEKMLSGEGISQSELSQFEARSAFESIAKDKHNKADLENRVFWPSVVGMVVGAGIAAFTEQKVYSSLMLINAGQAAAKSIAGWFLEDNIEEHYKVSALPAIRKVFDSRER